IASGGRRGRAEGDATDAIEVRPLIGERNAARVSGGGIGLGQDIAERIVSEGPIGLDGVGGYLQILRRAQTSEPIIAAQQSSVGAIGYAWNTERDLLALPLAANRIVRGDAVQGRKRDLARNCSSTYGDLHVSQ